MPGAKANLFAFCRGSAGSGVPGLRPLAVVGGPLIIYIGATPFGGCFSYFFNFFRKKDAEIFAGSEKVPTFASAFEKNTGSYKDRKFTVKELQVR